MAFVTDKEVKIVKGTDMVVLHYFIEPDEYVVDHLKK